MKTCRERGSGTFGRQVLDVFEVCPADSLAARTARSLPIPDFDDALQVAAAQKARVERIVTRNKKTFAARRSRL